MKRSADELDAENPVQDDKKKCTAKKLCPPFCEDDCPNRGSHDELILSLVNLQDSKLEEWKTNINQAKESRNLKQPLEDPSLDLHYPLLHWAAMLGKVKAVTWLLQQKFVDFSIDPANLVCSLSNVSNETVLFSMARFLHEGVKTDDPHQISKYFLSILDVLLKHDPGVLLVQEGNNEETVLHLCARGEEGSSAPFLMYMKRILVKLKDLSSEKNTNLPLKDILESKNTAGDTFLHTFARSNGKKAREFINFAEETFPTQSLEKMKNDDGKTTDDICKESTQEMCHSLIEAPDEGEDRPSRDYANVKQEISSQDIVGTSGDCNTGVHPEVQRVGGRGEERRKKEIPQHLFQEPSSDTTSYHLTSLQSVVEGIEGQHVLQTEKPDEAQESDLHGAGSPDQSGGTQPDGNTDTQSRALDIVRKLIRETELEFHQDKKELGQAKQALNECEERLKQLRAEKKEKEAVVQGLKERVQSKENKLKSYNSALQSILD